LVLKKTKTYISKESLRRPWNILKEYRVIRILEKFANYAFGHLWLPTHFAVLQFLIFSAFNILRHRKENDRITNFILCAGFAGYYLFWTLALEFAGRLEMEEKQIINSWKLVKFKTPQEKNFLRRFRRACRPFKFGSSVFFKVERLSILKFYLTLVHGTVRALVAIKNARS